MPNPTVTAPITPKQIQHAVESIVENYFPRPREELCIPVGEMERRLTAYVGEAAQAAYNDAGADIQRYQREARDAARNAGRRLTILRDAYNALRQAPRTPEVNAVLDTIDAEIRRSPWLAEQTAKEVARD